MEPEEKYCKCIYTLITTIGEGEYYDFPVGDCFSYRLDCGYDEGLCELFPEETFVYITVGEWEAVILYESWKEHFYSITKEEYNRNRAFKRFDL